MSKTELIKRYAVMIIGTMIMTFGIDITIHANIGTTPLSVLPNVFDIKFDFLTFGQTTMIWNVVLILAQVLILRKNFKKQELLQIPIAFLFALFLDLNEYLLFWLAPNSFIGSIIITLIGCVIIAFAISLTVLSDVVISCGEAIVKAVSDSTKLKFGYVKIGLDVLYVVLALAFSFIFFGTLKGVGIGTVILAILTGFFVNFFTKILTPLCDKFFSANSKK